MWNFMTGRGRKGSGKQVYLLVRPIWVHRSQLRTISVCVCVCTCVCVCVHVYTCARHQRMDGGRGERGQGTVRGVLSVTP